MPFEVFRRHQRKLLAIFAILAMFGFVVSDSLPKLLSPTYGGRDQAVVKLYGKTLYSSALREMLEERTIANRFVSLIPQLGPFIGPTPFGGVKDRDLVDALILQHEADRLHIPATPDMGREWLKRVTNNQMTSDTFELILARLNVPVSGEQVLAHIANQVRLANVRALPGAPLVTPYDVFRSFREQNERVAARAAVVPVEKFLAKVGEPSAAEVQAEYDKYKAVLPDPKRETPGFKVPRQIKVEILSIDGNALARGLKDKLTDSELRAAYENRKAEFKERSELPDDLFADQPELTPPIVKPFAEVRDTLALSLAEEKAQTEIGDKFTKIKEEVLIPFADKYATVLEDIDEAKKQGKKTKIALPEATYLADLARSEGLSHEITPLLSRAAAQDYGQIGTAEVGLTRLSGGRKFAHEFFDPKKSLYEPAELTDVVGRRFLSRKIQDVPSHVPPLEEVRSDVILAWKTARARPLAEKAAADLAEQLKKNGGTIKGETIGEFRVIAIPGISRRQINFLATRIGGGADEESPIPEVPDAGESFRDVYFALQSGSPRIAHNEPRSVYYVLALDRREPATFTALYAPNSDEYRYKMNARGLAARRLDENWMNWLRRQAGVTPDWVPPDEAKAKSASDET
jgi:peptidyl-prolyl cis-trans isomerase D